MIENKIIIENVKRFRVLLTESSESIIVDAIKDKRYLYFYYAGEGKQSRGYRTIKPYIIGTRNDGVEVLRGWQVDGDSSSMTGGNRRDGIPRTGHEKFYDPGLHKTVPGWREFRLDRILSVYPTGHTFKTDKLPTPYKGNNDSVITNVKAHIPTTYSPEPKERARKVIADKIMNRPSFKNDVEGWYNSVKFVKKRSPSKAHLYIDDRGRVRITYSERIIDGIDDNKVLGNLQELYNEHVLSTKKRTDTFLEKKKRESEKFKK